MLQDKESWDKGKLSVSWSLQRTRRRETDEARIAIARANPTTKRPKSPLEESTENVAKIIIPSLSTRWNLEERENETYMLRHFYVTLISLRSQRVVCVSSSSRTAAASLWRHHRAVLLLRGGPALPRPITSSLRESLAIQRQIWRKVLRSGLGLPSMPWRHYIESRGNSRKCEGENTKLVARLPSKCHPGTSFPLAGLASKSDRDKSYCKLKHFLHRKKKKTSHKINTFVSAITNRRWPFYTVGRMWRIKFRDGIVSAQWTR